MNRTLTSEHVGLAFEWDARVRRYDNSIRVEISPLDRNSAALSSIESGASVIGASLSLTGHDRPGSVCATATLGHPVSDALGILHGLLFAGRISSIPIEAVRLPIRSRFSPSGIFARIVPLRLPGRTDGATQTYCVSRDITAMGWPKGSLALLVDAAHEWSLRSSRLGRSVVLVPATSSPLDSRQAVANLTGAARLWRVRFMSRRLEGQPVRSQLGALRSVEARSRQLHRLAFIGWLSSSRIRSLVLQAFLSKRTESCTISNVGQLDLASSVAPGVDRVAVYVPTRSAGSFGVGVCAVSGGSITLTVSGVVSGDQVDNFADYLVRSLTKGGEST
jgi:hypothetical protein